MKRIFIAFFLIAFSVYIGVYSLNKTTKICKNMISRLEAVTEDVVDIKENSTHDKRVELYKKTNNLCDAWDETAFFLYLFFDSDNVKNIELNIKKAPIHVKNGDLDTTYLCLVDCIEELEYIKSSSIPDVENIF